LEKCWRGAKRRRLVLTPALSFEERENGSSSHGMLGQEPGRLCHSGERSGERLAFGPFRVVFFDGQF
jgi:hypothetical protein